MKLARDGSAQHPITLKAILTELTLSPALLISFHVNFNNNRKDPLRLLSILYNNKIKNHLMLRAAGCNCSTVQRVQKKQSKPSTFVHREFYTKEYCTKYSSALESKYFL